MSISYGGDKITSTDGGSLNPLSAIFRNRLIDAGFIINQRVYVSNTSLSSGTYAHDRWKAGSSGCTYTFTQGSAGVPITITITAGSLQQVIEGCNMPEGGTYVLSWEGTAQARFNGGTYGSSPLAVTGITAGVNTTIEFNTGTLLKPQLEVGSSATGFEYRQYGQELALCQRYFVRIASGLGAGGVGEVIGTGNYYTATQLGVTLSFPTSMRAAPSVYQTTGTNYYGFDRNGATDDFNSFSIYFPSTQGALLYNNTEASGTAGQAGTIYAKTGSSYLGLSAEL